MCGLYRKKERKKRDITSTDAAAPPRARTRHFMVFYDDHLPTHQKSPLHHTLLLFSAIDIQVSLEMYICERKQSGGSCSSSSLRHTTAVCVKKKSCVKIAVFF